MPTAEELVRRIREEGFRIVDFRFTDLAGRLRHTAVDAESVDPFTLEHGLFIDGSSVPGWRDVSESDLLLRPDLATAFADPFTAQPTLVFLCDASDPTSETGYERDPRSVARRACEHLVARGIAELARVAPEIDFFVFDDVRIEIDATRCGVQLQASETRTAAAQSYLGGNPGHRPAPGAAYLAMPPADHLADMRAEMANILRQLGFSRILHRHGRATSQCELGFEARPLLEAADRSQIAKYVACQVAASYGKSATFLPKPLLDEPGSALRVNLSLWRGDTNLFAGGGYADLSRTCLHFIAGVLAHVPALNAFTNPTTNSYKRLRPHSDEPVLATYAAFNRSAAIRIPFAASGRFKRIEVRFPDPSANPYLAFAAILMAGLDGIARKLEPGDAMDRNLYDLRPEEIGDLPRAAGSLEEALAALEADHGFLLEGEVFPASLIEGYLEVKRREIELVERTPHPVEFQLYYGH
ncbi:Glutamine synthetase [bacterium HR40]|nr:Glutamine synthetase [bacterium HR40]